MTQESRYWIGSDIGGTFTDTVLVDVEHGSVWTSKVLTTNPHHEGALQGIDAVLRTAGVEYADLRRVVHATTLVSNALIERRGARVGLLTTDGFADVLEIGREIRYDGYALDIRQPAQLAVAELRKGVTERVLSDGTPHLPLDESSARAAIGALVEADVDSYAICLLHSYMNPEHERRLAELVTEQAGSGTHVSVSSELAAEFREFERTSTTVANAYVQPLIAEYQSQLEAELTRRGCQSRLFIMLSEGGIATTDITSKHPIRMVESGPAAGVLGGVWMAEQIGESRLVSLDVGGTTAKACLVREGAPTRTNLFEVARTRRFMKGSGIPLSVPSIEMVEVGAGGGSIAQLDDAGILRVGPESAESIPGPACYGQGGTAATVTDANLVLGYLSASDFAGGTRPLDLDAAKAAIGEIADQIGVSLEDAAAAMVEIATEIMVGAVRVHLAEQGQDPRACALIASGGGGPLHGPTVARKMHMTRVVCPPRAGVFSALGLLVSPPTFNLGRTMITRLEDADWGAVNVLLGEMEADGRALLEGFDIGGSEIKVARSADMRRVGQTHSVSVPIPQGELGPDDAARIEASFEQVALELYGHSLGDALAEALTWRVSIEGPKPDLSALQRVQGTSRSREPRDCYFRGHGWLETAVIDRLALSPGETGLGPVLIEEHDSTALVGPGDRYRMDQLGNLIIEIGDAQ
ncbi:MAG TPA: hydantoinase/oxoprolinase family protein [Solirubrobacteraceae bacterium]|nr:hydantoinase/oxoprolinase family protein [Solirubrobacteraceae bacterium]